MPPNPGARIVLTDGRKAVRTWGPDYPWVDNHDCLLTAEDIADIGIARIDSDGWDEV